MGLILPRTSRHLVKRVISKTEVNNEKQKEATQSARNKYTAQFKEQALVRADKDGIPKVAQDLGLAEPMLYNWRAKRRQTGQPFEDQKPQQAELSRLKRGNARLEGEVAFLKKGVGVVCQATQVRYAMIKDNEGQFHIGMMCRLLSVSRMLLRL